MQVGEQVVLTENVIVVGSFGSELVTKGTLGIITEIEGNQAEIKTKYDSYAIPLASITSVGDMAA